MNVNQMIFLLTGINSFHEIVWGIMMLARILEDFINLAYFVLKNDCTEI